MEKETSIIVNVSGEGTITYSRIAELVGKRCAALPAWILYPLTSIFWRSRLMPFPPSSIDFIRYPWVADITKMKSEFGYTPRYTTTQAVESYLEGRRTREEQP
jgi:UDP-glucose 4-epimerase